MLQRGRFARARWIPSKPHIPKPGVCTEAKGHP